MIERLSGRRAFEELRAQGVRTGRGPVRLLSRPIATERTRIGYAIPRDVGTAVQRNRFRRRFRAVVAELDREVGLPGGDYLVRLTGPISAWSHARLRSTMADLLHLSACRVADPAGDPR